MKENNEWLYYRPTGEHIISETKDRQILYTFLPHPLTEVKIKVDDELSNLLCTANRFLGRLDGMSDFLPNVFAVEYILMHKEALLSCQIDGIEASLYNSLDVSLKRDNKLSPILNHVSAMRLGLERMQKNKFSNNLLCEIHGMITKDKKNASSGTFRDNLTIPGKFVVSTNIAPAYYPTAPEHFPAALRNLEIFISRVDDFDVMLKTALNFYQFETISPFVTCNGMIARMLTYIVLFEKKLITRPLACFSHYLSFNKIEYKDRMEMLHRQQDYEQWVKFFIRSIIYAANDSLAMIKSWLCLRKNNLNKIEASGTSVKAIKPLYEVIERFPIFDINSIARETYISYNTAAVAVKILSDLKIVRQTNKMTRNRDYAYVDFLNCFLSEEMLSFPMYEISKQEEVE